VGGRLPEIGEHIDVWIIEEALGTGGMGTVYRCRNRHAPRILAAIKLLDPSLSQHEEARLRFVREAELMFTLDHPGVAKVRNVRLDTSQPYMEMEFVEGESLQVRLASGPLPVTEVLDVGGQLSAALAYLHEQGIYHRDIKPANVLIRPDGQVKLVDFGLAVEAGGERITEMGTTLGTVAYAPPEWVRPEELDPRAWDVYALGVVLFEALTGREAFLASPKATVRQQVIQVMTEKQATDGLELGEDRPAALRELVRQMTARTPEERPASMSLIHERIEAMAADPEVDDLLPESDPVGFQSTRAMTPAPAPDRPRRPRPFLLVLSLGALLLGSVVVARALVPRLFQPGPSSRDVDVVVEQAGEAEVALRLANVFPSSVDGATHHFEAVPARMVTLDWAVGPGCAVEGCPGLACPRWCARRTTSWTVFPGEGVQTLRATAELPQPREVVLTTPEVDGEVRFWVDGREQSGPGTARFADVPTGPHQVEAVAGTCPPEAAGCAVDGECPTGCAWWSGRLTVLPEPGTLEISLPLPAPVPAEHPPTPPAKPTAEPPPEAPPEQLASPVSRAEFAAWLATHADWAADPARASGRADANYLRDWDDDRPPASGPMVDVSWWAAWAYCEGRGGLAALDGEPLSWTEDATQPFQEWRVDGERAAWRRFDGVSSHAVRKAESNAFTGFRCAR